ncbi:MAG: glycosyltransferase [Prevotellaceae bacterium]|jgi:glycosyltransferase involved in cell wall biosynthesis|nr:glycosyltransferase [Prevotellaceae bacterium]
MPNVVKPLFSIITVTRNAQAVVEDTLQSVTRQTYPWVEYILIDGASTDRTMAIAERYRNRMAHLISQPDHSLYEAMNTGMALATGDYLCFLNAGDTFHTADTLQQVVDSLAGISGLPDVLYGQTVIVDRDRHFLHPRRLVAPERLTWKSFRQGMLVCHQAFFARRTLAEPYDLNYRYSADFDWCIRVMKRSHTLHYTQLTLIDYLDEGLTTRHHRASLGERFRIMVHHYGWVSTVLYHAWFLVRQLKS